MWTLDVSRGVKDNLLRRRAVVGRIGGCENNQALDSCSTFSVAAWHRGTVLKYVIE